MKSEVVLKWKRPVKSGEEILLNSDKLVVFKQFQVCKLLLCSLYASFRQFL